jgi:hypothetical protein
VNNDIRAYVEDRVRNGDDLEMAFSIRSAGGDRDQTHGES